MGLTATLPGPIGPYQRTFHEPRHKICQVVTPRILLRSHSNRTSLQLAAGGSICFVGTAGHACISTGRLDATAGGFPPSEHGVDDGSCAAHSRFYAECFYGTVSRTGATLHAGIAVRNFNLSIRLTQDRVGTDEKTGATPDAFLSIKSQRDNILQINQLTRHARLLKRRIAIQSIG